MPRPYKKKDLDYWNNLSKGREEISGNVPHVEQMEISEPISVGEPFYTSTANLSYAVASRSGSSNSLAANGGNRINRAAVTTKQDRFSAIRSLPLPYEYGNQYVSIRDTIDLCQRAYAGVPVFRNAIDLMAEFSNTEIYLDKNTGTKKSRDFFNLWFKKIDLWSLKKQYFLEYYRSSNIFLYKLEGQFDAESFYKFQRGMSDSIAKVNKIPVRYIILNPYFISGKLASSFSGNVYEKVLSQYDLQRLKNAAKDKNAPEEDKAAFEALPPDIQKQVRDGTFTTNGIFMKLNEKNLLTSFRKKMDYEPFAIPFGYGVLEDLNSKLELKKMDAAITRTVENAVLHIKLGAPPDKNGNVQYPFEKMVTAMQNLFKSESTGRVVISDWTSEMEFVIPDLNKILGAEKYEILDKDIKEGLQNVLVGEEKYGNTQAKIQVFLDKLREARESFVNDFLQKEIKRISKEMGFRSYPEVKFKEIDAKDNTQFLRIATRLAELNLLTPEELMDAFNFGKLPPAEEIGKFQQKFRDQRKDGYFNPLSPAPVLPPPFDPNAPKPTGPSGAKAPPNPKGRPFDTTTKASLDDYKEVVRASHDFATKLAEMLCEKYEVGELTDNQKEVLGELHEKIISSAEMPEWESLAAECLEDNSRLLSLYPIQEIEDCMLANNLGPYEAALKYHAGQ